MLEYGASPYSRRNSERALRSSSSSSDFFTVAVNSLLCLSLLEERVGFGDLFTKVVVAVGAEAGVGTSEASVEISKNFPRLLERIAGGLVIMLVSKGPWVAVFRLDDGLLVTGILDADESDEALVVEVKSECFTGSK